ncbi:unnamed protein product [Rotaria socialis]|uniref:Nuclear receptor domain-containing protein n=1 Tax=Rotaria socialis TaxID=392032 RepID=A0A820YB43_9BILA|nr:unnamed protein product [Rotaria socialis]
MQTMNITNDSTSIYPYSSLQFDCNHQELDETNTSTISVPASLDLASFKNHNYSSMLIMNHQQKQSINEDKDKIYREYNFYYVSFIIIKDTVSLFSAIIQLRNSQKNTSIYFSYSSHEATVPATNFNSSTIQYGGHHCHLVYPLGHCQQTTMENSNGDNIDSTEGEKTKDNRNVLSNDLNEDEYCKICGDLASGWHCGAITCEACKKFFLRSISTCNGKKKYKCQRDLNCLVTKRSRTQCQYCRFQKCISVGMKAHESVGSKTEDLYKKLPCLICNASASGIHFGAVTCEACKGFFRRSIKENAPERYHCAENNNCEIISTIRQLQNNSTSMATIMDSARIASMAKKRKTKNKIGKIFASINEIDIELSPAIREFVDKAFDAYLIYLKDLPRCIPRESVWSTMTSQMIIYAQAIMNFCQSIIPGFSNTSDKYEIISSSINSVIMVTLLRSKILTKSSSEIIHSIWNYWQAEPTLSMELNAHVPQLAQAENLFLSFESKLRHLRLDEKEFSLLLLMIITRNKLNVINGDNKLWSTYQYECVQAFSEYSQARRSKINREFSIEFYDIAFLVSQIRSLNHRVIECFMNLPWPYVRNLPSFFYRIYVPCCDSSLSVLNSSLYNNCVAL